MSGFPPYIVHGNISCQNKNKFKKIVRISCKLGTDVTVLQDLCNRYSLDQMKNIMKDEKHPLKNMYRQKTSVAKNKDSV